MQTLNSAKNMEILQKRERAFRYVNAALIALFCAWSVAGGVVRFREGLDYYGWVGVLGPLLIPLIWGVMRVFRIRPARQMNCIFYAFLVYAYVMGVVMRGYDSSHVMDKISHTFAGMMTSMLGLIPFYHFKANRRIEEGDLWFAAAFAFCFSMMTAPVWELCEFAVALLAGIDTQKVVVAPGGPFWLPVRDTMLDMLVHMVGSVLFIGSMWLYYRRGKRLLLMGAFEAFHAFNAKISCENGEAKENVV